MSIENEIAMALEKNDDARACALMDGRFNPDYAINGDPLLFRAAEQPHVPNATRKLIAKGATVDLANWRGMSPLIACADRGHNMDVLKELVEHDADIDYCVGGYRDALFFAQLSGWEEGVAYLSEASGRREAERKALSSRKVTAHTKSNRDRSAGRDRTA